MIKNIFNLKKYIKREGQRQKREQQIQRRTRRSRSTNKTVNKLLLHTMAQRINLPMNMVNHTVIRLQGSIIVFGGEKYWSGRSCGHYIREITTHNHIWVCNLYTEQWRTYVIDKTNKTPIRRDIYCSLAIGRDIYVFAGGLKNNTATLWKLARNRKGYFSWSDIVVERPPSVRWKSEAWEYGEKLWMFGGGGPNPAEVGYVNEYVDFELSYRVCDDHGQMMDFGANNQLICFEPSRQEWTSVKCFGNVPPPHCDVSSAIIGDETYVFKRREQTDLAE